jgi:hypothetical protein
MGVPVNLDEVDSHRLAALPPLRITTGAAVPQPRRAETLDSNGRYTSAQKGKSKDLGSGRNSTGVGRETKGKNALGEKPEMDERRAEELCGLEEGESDTPTTTCYIESLYDRFIIDITPG